MTPDQAREINRLEFEADCRRARERAFALVAERRAAAIAQVLKFAPYVPASFNIPPQRAARQYEFRGETHCLARWAEITGHPIGRLRERLRKGMTLEQALTTPRLLPGVRWHKQPGVADNFADNSPTGGPSSARDIS